MPKKKEIKKVDLKETLWKAAEKLRNQMDAAEYKHIVLGLIFLKYISDTFDIQKNKIEQLVSDEKSDFFISQDPKIYKKELEDRDYYTQDNVFWVPEKARWEKLRAKAKQPDIGSIIDNAMIEIENENKFLKGKLDKRFALTELNEGVLGSLIDQISKIGFNSESLSKDLLGEVYEYFLGKFALAEGKKGGQFYTPSHVVETLVSIISPYKGRIYDPCCGSGGMFVQSHQFIKSHGGKINDVSIYGQESNPTTWRLALMNLSIRGFSADLGRTHGDTFGKDQFPDLKFDYILANPPFNDSDWGGEKFLNDQRWIYGQPPLSNANYAWLQHIIYKLKNNGKAAVVLAKASLTSNSSNENIIRKNLINENIVDAIIELPDKLFTNFSGPVCIWVFDKNKKNKNILLIDASKFGKMQDASLKYLDKDEITKLGLTYNNWKSNTNFKNINNFCKSVSPEEIKKLDYSLSVQRYLFKDDKKNDISTEDEIASLLERFEFLKVSSENSNKKILNSLKQFKFKVSSKEKETSNLNINQTLEKIGIKIFKLWFVDYKIPGHNIIDNKKFKIVDNLKIPEGWSYEKCKERFDISIGRTPPRKEFKWFSDDENDIPWLSIADMKDANIYIKKTSEFLTKDAIKKFNVPIIKPGTTICSFKLTVGRVAITSENIATNEAIAHYVPKKDNFLNIYIYFYLKNFLFKSLGSTSSIGTAINSTILKEMKIIFPPDELIKKFNNLVNPILQKSLNE